MLCSMYSEPVLPRCKCKTPCSLQSVHGFSAGVSTIALRGVFAKDKTFASREVEEKYKTRCECEHFICPLHEPQVANEIQPGN